MKDVRWCYIDASLKEKDKSYGQSWFSFTGDLTVKIMGSMNIQRSLLPLHAKCEAFIWATECMMIIKGEVCNILLLFVEDDV